MVIKMNNDPQFKFFQDDGTEFNPNLIAKPSLCISCKKDNDPKEEMLCMLNRADQEDEEEFRCDAFEKITES
jgi:hypothetical protein